MKKILYLLLLPCATFCSHSIETGLFYSVHKETGYRYKLGGMQINYEIGNSKGLKAHGKVRFSNDSDLLYFQANSQILYYIPFEAVEIFPFLGVQIDNHIVYQNDRESGVLNRSYFPIGAGIKYQRNAWIGIAKIGHLHSMSHSLIVDKDEGFVGKKLWLKNAYSLEAKMGYQLTERAYAYLATTWTQAYKGSLKQWTNELTAQYAF